MGHTRDIDITIPADTELISVGAQRIREIKGNIEERMELDHWWTNELDDTVYDADGRHRKITMKAYGVSIYDEDTNLIYTKTEDESTDLHYIDSLGNDSQIIKADKLVYYDNRVNASCFYGMGAKPGRADSYSVINFTVDPTQTIDHGSDYSSGIFTVPKAGYYYIKLGFLSNSNDCYVTRNGGTILEITPKVVGKAVLVGFGLFVYDEPWNEAIYLEGVFSLNANDQIRVMGKSFSDSYTGGSGEQTYTVYAPDSWETQFVIFNME